MIHVSCGSYSSTALEIFLNFYKCLSPQDKELYLLHINEDLLNQYCVKSGCDANDLNIYPLTANQDNLCATSLLSALSHAKNNDLLLTLPANKADLKINNITYLGHTEFLRSHWNNPNLPMSFITPRFSLLLLTDHLPLRDVVINLNAENIAQKVLIFLNAMLPIQVIKRIIFWGVNPHAGENSLLGIEENQITAAMKIISKNFSEIELIGPIASDGTFNYQLNNIHDLIVSPYHDQGLVFLKSNLGFLATNITFGGPIIRVSPDHGTAVDLLFKKKALYTSLLWTHQWIKSWLN